MLTQENVDHTVCRKNLDLNLSQETLHSPALIILPAIFNEIHARRETHNGRFYVKAAEAETRISEDLFFPDM